MAWSPIGVTVSVTASGGAGTQFLGAGSPNVVTNAAFSNLISRVFNNTATTQKFSLGTSNHTPKQITIGPNTFMFVAHGPTDNFIIADAITVQIIPGQGQV